MFVVVNLHRAGVNVRFKRVVGVGQRRQRERAAARGGDQWLTQLDRFLGDRAGQRGRRLGDRAGQRGERSTGKRGGFNGLASGHHNLVSWVWGFPHLTVNRDKKFKRQLALWHDALRHGLWPARRPGRASWLPSFPNHC